jgi:hypothetical protein
MMMEKRRPQLEHFFHDCLFLLIFSLGLSNSTKFSISGWGADSQIFLTNEASYVLKIACTEFVVM